MTRGNQVSKALTTITNYLTGSTVLAYREAKSLVESSQDQLQGEKVQGLKGLSGRGKGASREAPIPFV